MKAKQYAQQIRNTLQQLSSFYDAAFSGQPRMSRRAELLDQWLKSLDGLSRPLKLVSGSEKKALNDEIAARKKLYRDEAQAIRALQAMSPLAREMFHRTEWGGLIHDRYARHFAGQSRGTRDVQLLAELLLDTESLMTDLGKLKEDEGWAEIKPEVQAELSAYIDLLKDRAELYRSEREAINSSATQGEPEERAGRLAAIANQGFAVYRHQFQGHSRSSRRQSTLSRVVASLAEVLEQMRALSSQGFKGEHHSNNIELVTQNLSLYREEVKAIASAQESLGFDEWYQALISEAQSIFEGYREQYAGKARAACSPEPLVYLCDRLVDVISQLRPLIQDSPDEQERVVFQQMLDQARVYHREWGAVTQAQPSANVEQGH